MKNFDTEVIREATLVDWCIVKYPDIYNSPNTPEVFFAKLNCGQPIALFGRAKNDPRYNAETGAFADGHQLVTSPIVIVKGEKCCTLGTIYTIDKKDINADFKKWCQENPE